MIAKINTGQSLDGALAYNQEKVDEGLGKVLTSNLVCEPMDGCFSVQTTAADFARKVIKDNSEPKRRKEITELLAQKYGLIPAHAPKQPELRQLTPVDPAQG